MACGVVAVLLQSQQVKKRTPEGWRGWAPLKNTRMAMRKPVIFRIDRERDLVSLVGGTAGEGYKRPKQCRGGLLGVGVGWWWGGWSR